MSAVEPFPAPEVMRIHQTAAYARCHPDTIRKHSRPGAKRRLHGHHTTDGTFGGLWLHKTRVVAAWLDGADYAAQVRLCGATCPENTAEVTPLTRRRTGT